MLTYPIIDPVLVEIGPFAIRWYALAYVAGVVLGYRTILHLASRWGIFSLNKDARDNIIFAAILGIIIGGRLGYILFYQFDYYLAHPLDILKIWQGGMAFHGGILGVIIAFYLFTRRYHLPYLSFMDAVACAAPIGLFFGRIANFINGELYGRVSTVPWAMVFPHGGPDARHPSQLYEAGLEGIVLFLLLYFISRFTHAYKYAGLLSGLFLIGYAIARFAVEFFREPDEQLGLLFLGASMGQLLCLPMLLAGLMLAICAKKSPGKTA